MATEKTPKDDSEADKRAQEALDELGLGTDETKILRRLKRELEEDSDGWNEEDRIQFESQSLTTDINASDNEIDISMRNLSKLPEDFFEIVPEQIHSIVAYRNLFKQIPDELARLTTIELIDFSSNRLTSIPDFCGTLSTLRGIDLSENQITDLPDSLFDLPTLRELHLSGNSIRQLPKMIGNLHSLDEMKVSHNQLTSLPEELGNLKNLVTLDLSSNTLIRLPINIGKLTKLTDLFLSENKLKSLPPSIQWLQALDQLHLSGNELKTLPSQIGRLHNLRSIDLSNNLLTSLPSTIGKLSRLEHIDLSGNELRTLPKELGNLPDSVSLDVSGNPLAEPLPTIIGRGTSALLSYLRSLGDGTPQYEAKVLLVGEGGVGKSSLIAVLRGDQFVENRLTTHGIEIDGLKLEHPFLKQDLILNSWDFGGQEVYRITHQFFFSKRALYLLVWKPREGQEENNVEAWCRRIRLRVGEHARIIIVATHADERRPEFDYAHLKAKFPNLIVGYHEVDSGSGRGIVELKYTIAFEASKLPQMGELISQSWSNARNEITQQDGPHIPRWKFESICNSHGLDEAETETLSSLLHDLGHIIHYSDDDGLRDIVVLQPEWLTKAIGFVLEDEETRSKGGVLSHSRLSKIWSENLEGITYDPKLHPYFLRLMEKFDVSYRLPDLHTSLVAQLVPYERPGSLWQDRGSSTTIRRRMRAICRTAEEAPGLIAWLTVRNHRFTVGKHWRRGVLLVHERYASQALFELADNNRDLALTVTGPSPDYFFHVLVDGIEELINLRWRGLGYSFLIPCLHKEDSKVACTGTIPLSSLQKFRERGEPRIVCSTCANWSDVSELLTGFGRLAAPLDHLLEGIRHISNRVDAIESSSADTARYLRTILKVISTEVVDCPRLFTLIPEDRSTILTTISTKDRFTLTLWCEEPGSEHPREEATYSFKPPKGWIQAVSPYVRYVTKLLRFAIPIGAAFYAASMSEESLKHAKADLDLMKALADKLPESQLDADPVRGGMTKPQGAALRALRSLVMKLDPENSFGDLRRVTSPAGDTLWVCPEHYRQYDPGLPEI